MSATLRYQINDPQILPLLQLFIYTNTSTTVALIGCLGRDRVCTKLRLVMLLGLLGCLEADVGVPVAATFFKLHNVTHVYRDLGFL